MNKEEAFVPEVIPRSSKALTIQEFSRKWKDFVDFVGSQLKEGTDYGKVPGISKPFLMLPGAQKIMSRYVTRPEYEILSGVEDWNRGLFSFQLKCILRLMSDNRIVGEGIGSCNSFEEKYRYLWMTKKKLGDKTALAQRARKGKNGWYTEYKIERDDLASLHNTILKMAKKRAVVDASLTLSNASEYFTQDIEDVEVAEEEKPEDEQKFERDYPEKVRDITPEQINELKKLAKEIGYKKLDLQAYTRDPKLYHQDMQVFSRMKELIAEVRIQQEQSEIPAGFLNHYSISTWDELHRVTPARLEDMIDELRKLPLANKIEKVESKKQTKAEKIQQIKDALKDLGYTENSPEVTSMLQPYGAFNVKQLDSLKSVMLDKILKEEFAQE